jgi:hypothetical protein
MYYVLFLVSEDPVGANKPQLLLTRLIIFNRCFILMVSKALRIVHNTRISDMQDALVAIKDGGVPPPSILPSFQEIKDTLGFNRYYKEEKQYQVVS